MKLVNALKFALVIAVFICGCSKTGVTPVGVWGNAQLPETVEFRSDKSGVFVVKGQPSLAFTWEAADDSRVKVNVNFQGTIRSLAGRIDGDTFFLEGAGQQATYHRLKE